MSKPKQLIIQDNLLNTQDKLVAHCCNIQNTMGSGVALALRNRFPEVYTADSAAYIMHGKTLLGRSIVVPVETSPEDTKIEYVVNMYGQPNYGYVGRHINYESFYQCLEQLAKHCEDLQIKSLSMPYNIGCQRAGGCWEIVKAMIDDALSGQGLTINLYQI